MQDVEQITGQALYCAGLLRKGESLSGNVVFKDLVLKCLTPSGTGAPVNWRKLFKDFPELIDRLEDEIKAMEDIGGFFQSRADTDKGSSSTDNSGITRYSGKIAAGMEPVPGYRLEEKLGEGGFGEVWRAIGPGGFPMALKFVGLKEKTKAFELRSLDLLKSLRHPNLLVTFGSWETENNLVIAMELADCSLHDVFKKYQSRNSSGIPFDELINYMEGASEGIDYLNSYQSPFSGDSKKVAIQHRDIKPQNLLIVGGKAKIGDFGLIRKLETNETSHTGMMTSAFAAPEFFEGKTSNNSDQYSLAVSYCLLRGGSLPFSGSIVQILKGHNSPDLTMLPEIERKIVKKALAKNPSNRWKNCKAFTAKLKNATKNSNNGKGNKILKSAILVAIILGSVIPLLVYLNFPFKPEKPFIVENDPKDKKTEIENLLDLNQSFKTETVWSNDSIPPGPPELIVLERTEDGFVGIYDRMIDKAKVFGKITDANVSWQKKDMLFVDGLRVELPQINFGKSKKDELQKKDSLKNDFGFNFNGTIKQDSKGYYLSCQFPSGETILRRKDSTSINFQNLRKRYNQNLKN